MAQSFARLLYVPAFTVSSSTSTHSICHHDSSSSLEPESKNAALAFGIGGSKFSTRITKQLQMKKLGGCRLQVRAAASATTPAGLGALTIDHQHRSVLGVGPNATKQDIKQAYRRLALRFHPDVCKEQNCSSSFKEVNCAYEYLITCCSTTTPVHDAYSSNFAGRASASMEQYYSSASSSFHQFGSAYYSSKVHEPRATAAQGPGDGEDDPWADFLQSLVNGTCEESKHYSPVDYYNFPPKTVVEQSNCWTSRSSSFVNSTTTTSAHRRRSSSPASTILDGNW